LKLLVLQGRLDWYLMQHTRISGLEMKYHEDKIIPMLKSTENIRDILAVPTRVLLRFLLPAILFISRKSGNHKRIDTRGSSSHKDALVKILMAIKIKYGVKTRIIYSTLVNVVPNKTARVFLPAAVSVLISR